MFWFNSSFVQKRLYFNRTATLESIAAGDDHVCAIVNGSGVVKCWRGDRSFQSPSGSDRFVSISSGSGFSCGILASNSQVRCWGSNSIAREIEAQFGNTSMSSIVAGSEHVCGLNSSGFVICKGNNHSGEIEVPFNSAMEYSNLALGSNHSCAIRRSNGSVICWGRNEEFSRNGVEGISFESIASGTDFTCGLTTRNLSIICWGPGWVNSTILSVDDLPFSDILPGPCVQSDCGSCGLYPQSHRLCHGKGNICRTCLDRVLIPILPPALTPLPPPPPPESSSSSKGLRRDLLIFAIVGSVGAFSAICTVVYCLWSRKQKIHNSVQPRFNRGSSSGNSTSNSHLSRSSTIKRQISRKMKHQRSGTSSKNAERAEEFILSELVNATNNFSMQNKIGAGSYGVVYRGKLSDGREVAIKRGEIASKETKFQEKENAFDSELSFLSRLHHKHLVRLVGFCEEKEEKLLVYEYMKNGALHDHLHVKNNVKRTSSVLNSWKMRIKIALDAARGIEYLHNYAVPTIIHRDIKSSNILLDANWNARVSDFGLSLGPDSYTDHKPLKAVGTVGYIDPEYYSLNVLTEKSDVYGLGVVLLELLTGKRAIFRDGENGIPISLVDYAVPAIVNGGLVEILDPGVGPPELNEAEAVELVAYTAMHCVSLEGKDRPTMTDVVANLERAFILCGSSSHGSISSDSNSIHQE